MLYYFKKDKNATEMQNKISAVYGQGAATDQTCQKWFVKFHAGDFPLHVAPRSGRPVEVDSDQTDILKISKSIKLSVKIKMCLLFYGKIHTDFLASPILLHSFIHSSQPLTY